MLFFILILNMTMASSYLSKGQKLERNTTDILTKMGILEKNQIILNHNNNENLVDLVELETLNEDDEHYFVFERM